ncbi:MAG: hypothetical protein AAF555_10730 [Verrucomicrobiota bacterium]
MRLPPPAQVLALLALVSLTACQLKEPSTVDPSPAGVSTTAEITAVPEANLNSPIPVSLVAASDPALIAQLEGLTSLAWLHQQATLERTFAGLIEVAEGQIQPGTTSVLRVPSPPGGGPTVFAFAIFHFPGEHRIRLQHGAVNQLTLAAQGWSQEPQAAETASGPGSDPAPLSAPPLP